MASHLRAGQGLRGRRGARGSTLSAGRVLGLGLIVLGGLGSAAPAPASALPAQPNFIVIVTDDQHEGTVTPDLMPRTVKKLAPIATRFTDSIVSSPLCCPARATMITGQYSHNNGVLDNIPGYADLREKGNTLPVWLKRAGYKTAHVGKYLNEYRRNAGKKPAPGWNRWFTLLTHQFQNYSISQDGRRKDYGDRPGDYLTRVLNDRAKRFVHKLSRRSKPFYLQVDQFAPHAEYITTTGRCSNSAIPDPNDISRINRFDLPQPPNFNADNSKKPGFVSEGFPELGPSQIAEITRQYQCRVGSLRAVDRGVGQIMSTLKRTKLARETIVIFTSDNGYFFGEHRIPDYKHFPYEESIRVPLYVRVPPGYKNGSGLAREVAAPVAGIDLAPTILDYAGADPCRPDGKCRVMDGRSLRPLLDNGDPAEVWPSARAMALELSLSRPDEVDPLGRLQPPGMTCTYTAVRVDGQVYVEHTRGADATGTCVEVSDKEHYNLLEDPYQLDNLFPGKTPELQYFQSGLEARLRSIETCSGIQGRDPRPPKGISYCE